MAAHYSFRHRCGWWSYGPSQIDCDLETLRHMVNCSETPVEERAEAIVLLALFAEVSE